MQDAESNRMMVFFRKRGSRTTACDYAPSYKAAGMVRRNEKWLAAG
jgi:hypothetical protein